MARLVWAGHTDVLADIWALRDYVIWRAALPGRWTILICDTIMLSANALLLFVSYKAFDREAISTYTGLFARCGLVYFMMAMPAILIDHENNLINRHYLDKRRRKLTLSATQTQFEILGNLGKEG